VQKHHVAIWLRVPSVRNPLRKCDGLESVCHFYLSFMSLTVPLKLEHNINDSTGQDISYVLLKWKSEVMTLLIPRKLVKKGSSFFQE